MIMITNIQILKTIYTSILILYSEHSATCLIIQKIFYSISIEITTPYFRIFQETFPLNFRINHFPTNKEIKLYIKRMKSTDEK